MSEEGVRDMLGNPYKEYSKDNAPSDYYIHGYEYEERSIGNRVLIYIKGDVICYVYINGAGKVEHTFVGGS